MGDNIISLQRAKPGQIWNYKANKSSLVLIERIGSEYIWYIFNNGSGEKYYWMMQLDDFVDLFEYNKKETLLYEIKEIIE